MCYLSGYDYNIETYYNVWTKINIYHTLIWLQINIAINLLILIQLKWLILNKNKFNCYSKYINLILLLMLVKQKLADNSIDNIGLIQIIDHKYAMNLFVII